MNGLKGINDTQGHQVGDKLISGFTQILKETFEGVGIVGRMGGDEFTVIIDSIENFDYEAYIEKLFEKMKEAKHKEMKVYKLADQRMYEYKRAFKENNKEDVYMGYLLKEEFLGFEIGEFPYDKSHTAMGEYHYVVNEGNYGVWCDQVCNYTYNGSGASWIITEDDGNHYMEQMRVINNRPHKTHPMLITGVPYWHDYTVSATLRVLKKSGNAGIGFFCRNSLNLWVFALDNGMARLEYRHKQVDKICVEKKYSYDSDTFYNMKVVCKGSSVECFINDEFLFGYDCGDVGGKGKVAITANVPAQFKCVNVEASDETIAQIEKEKESIDDKNKAVQDKHPKMKLVKKIDLKNFGTGRQVRFGHLTGTKEWFVVLAQGQKRVHRDAYGHISCLTAIDMDGNILWQKGEPSTKYEHGQISADMPLQVYDIDGDGIDEVITARNFEVMILDGRTGEVKKKAKMPVSSEDDGEKIIGVNEGIYAFDRINPDGIRIANFSGKDRPSDILVKDRYCRVYALNSDLELMWKFKSDKNTGHFPYAIDINGDGYDELLCGYNLLDHNGKLIWSAPINEDHTDEIISGRFMAGEPGTPEAEGHFACVSGTQGFNIIDYKGNIVKHDDIGHAQRISTGNYCPERRGFELAVTNFWGHQGVVYLYDCYGNPIWEYENELNGNMVTPVNWDGDGIDLILLNADPKRGGMLDGEGNTAVVFPDDGHPVMCVEAIDLFGDSRDELVVWDYHWMYIYTQSDGVKENAYAPVKYPHYAASNYRGEYSYPDESYLV